MRARIVTAIATVVMSSMLYGQTVMQPWDNPCAGEIVQPNLELRIKQHLIGTLKDQSGAPFVRSRILIQRFRDKGKSTSFKEVVTDDQGHFDFGVVNPGTYRFLPSPTRSFKQPKQVACYEGEICELSLTLEANPTDQAFSSCPVQ